MYYLIEIAHGDTKIEGKGIYTYNTEREAIANFHSKLGTAMKSDLYTSEVLVVIDQLGTVKAHEYYTAPAVATEAVTEE